MWRSYLVGARRRERIKEWRQRGYLLPASYAVKIEVLLHRGDPEATWIETDAYFGETTEVSGRRGRHAYTTELAAELAERARVRLEGRPNVSALEGTSGTMVDQTLDCIKAIQFLARWPTLIRSQLSGHLGPPCP